MYTLTRHKTHVQQNSYIQTRFEILVLNTIFEKVLKGGLWYEERKPFGVEQEEEYYLFKFGNLGSLQGRGFNSGWS